MPAGFLLELMIPPTGRMQIAGARATALVVRHEMIQVADVCWAAAPRRGAGRVPDLHKVREPRGGSVTDRLACMIAVPSCAKPFGRQAAEPLPDNERVASRRGRARACVPNGVPIVGDQSQAAPGAGQAAELSGDVAAGPRVDRSVPGNLAWVVGLPEPG